MKLRNLISLLAVLILSIASGSSSLYAQGTDLGTIRGTVTDSGGALLPNAQVEITDLANLTTHRATTNQHGEYEVPALPGGGIRQQSRRPDSGRPSSTASFLTAPTPSARMP